MAYARQLAVDRQGSAMQEYPPPFIALQKYGSENGIASSVVSLTHDTTTIEVTAVGSTAFLKWIPTTNTNPSVISAVATANYDHAIPANTNRKFVVPIEGPSISGSVVGVNRLYGLYQRVAIKSAGIASVLLSEY